VSNKNPADRARRIIAALVYGPEPGAPALHAAMGL